MAASGMNPENGLNKLTMSKNQIQMPIIHMNGTSPETLLEDNLNAFRAIGDALDVIRKMEFNGRDYYPVAGSFEAARDQREVHIQHLRDAKDYFMAICEHCSDEVAAREARRAGK